MSELGLLTGTNAMSTLKGVVRGQTIILEENSGLADGEVVEIHVVAKSRASTASKLVKNAGGLASKWTDEDDRILEQLAEDRLRSIHREST